MTNIQKHDFLLPHLNLQFFSEDKPETFTKEEVDEMIANAIKKRLARVKSEVPEDYEDLKKKLKEFEDEALSDKDKAAKAIERKDAEIQAKVKEIEQLKEKNRTITIEAAFEKAALKVGIDNEKIDDAKKLADLSEVEIDEKGNVLNLAKVVENLATNKPYLKKNSPDIGDPANPKKDTQTKKITKDEFLKLPYKERAKIAEEDPELFKELTKL